jgi:hypothetical protein
LKKTGSFSKYKGGELKKEEVYRFHALSRQLPSSVGEGFAVVVPPEK